MIKSKQFILQYVQYNTINLMIVSFYPSPLPFNYTCKDNKNPSQKNKKINKITDMTNLTNATLSSLLPRQKSKKNKKLIVVIKFKIHILQQQQKQKSSNEDNMIKILHSNLIIQCLKSQQVNS